MPQNPMNIEVAVLELARTSLKAAPGVLGVHDVEEAGDDGRSDAALRGVRLEPGSYQIHSLVT